LAQAVNSQDTGKIKKIANKNPELLNVQDSEYETTLLIWAVGMEKYDSVEALLESGADPNIISVYYGYTALYLASGYSWIDWQAQKDPQYVNILLKYGADPNIVTVAAEKSRKTVSADGTVTYIGIGTSPLMQSIGCGIEKTKALVEAGANIDYKNEEGETAAIIALQGGKLEYAYYLIVEKKANIKDSYFINLGFDDPNIPESEKNKKYYPVDSLNDWQWNFPLDSDEYKLKMEIIEEFARQGVDY